MTQAFCQQFWQQKLRGFLENSLWQAAGSANTSAEEVRQSLRCLEARDVTDRTHPLEHLVPPTILDCSDAQKVFWWFWRCFPQAIANANHANANPVCAQAGGLAGAPQFDVNWDWSHASVSAALAGARAGYLATRSPGSTLNSPQRRSHPHLALFKFTPVFDLVQTSQTEQEIWAGSWISHYLAAKICWRIARKYGPDTFLSPCLYAHSWIDYWLLQQYPDFGQWIATPTPEARMQSQFPNTLMMILPDNGSDPNVAKHHPVWATMIYAEQTLKQEWLALSHQIVTTLHAPQIERQMGDLKRKEQWLEASWQPYWVALPIPDDRTSVSKDASELAQSTPTAIIPSNPTPLTSTQASLLQASLLQQAHSCLQRLEHSKLWKLPTLFSCYAVDAGNQAGKALEAHQNLDQESHQSVHQTINQLIQRKLSSILPDLIASESKEWRHCAELPAFQWRVLALINWRQAATEQPHDSVAELTATAAFNRALLTFSQHHLLSLMQRHQAQLLWSTPGCLLASLPLQGWQDWVWDLQQAWENFCLLDQPSLRQFHQSSGINVRVILADATIPLPRVLGTLRYNQPLDPAINPSLRAHGQDLDTIQVQVLGKTHPLHSATASFAAWKEWRSLLQLRPASLAICATAPSYLRFLQLLQQTSSPETFDRDVQNWLHLAVFHPACEVR